MSLPSPHTPFRGGFRRGAVVAAALASVALAGCESLSPLGKRNEAWTSGPQYLVGQQARQQLLSGHPLVTDPDQLAVVERVGKRLAEASSRADWRWRFELIEDDSARVVALPGGNVVVSDTLLAACDNEGQLAAALAHEMGHLLAGHGQERLHAAHGASADQVPRMPLAADAFAAGDPAQTRPYSLRHESEADSIALSLLVRAGYDPEAAHAHWTRAAAEQATPAFRSLARVHPVDRNRLTQLQTLLSQARQVYRSHPGQVGTGEHLAFQVQRPVPVVPARAPSSMGTPPATRVGSSHWTATVNRGAAKPDTWNSDLKPPEAATFTAHADGPALPPERAIRQAAFEEPDEDEWLTPIVRSDE